MCSCQSQVCNPLQNDYALYLRSCQMNQEGLETEHVMGHSCARITVTMQCSVCDVRDPLSLKDFIQYNTIQYNTIQYNTILY